jgi:hypothetical protein
MAPLTSSHEPVQYSCVFNVTSSSKPVQSARSFFHLSKTEQAFVIEVGRLGAIVSMAVRIEVICFLKRGRLAKTDIIPFFWRRPAS